MSPQTQIELASILTKIIISSLLFHNNTMYKEWLKSINNSRQSMYKFYFGQDVKLQSAVV